MHLFRGLLLFFKDTHRGHSCRSNHQSPSTLLLLPSTTVFTLCFYPLRGLCFFSFGNDDKTAADCKSSLFVSFNSCPSRKDTLVNKYDIKFRCKTGKTSLFFKSPFCVCNRPFISPLGFLLSDPCAHSSQSYHSSHDTWLSSATPLSRARHSGIWLMLSPSVVICLICPAFWDVSKTSWMFPELAHSWFPPGWLADISHPALYTVSLFFPLCVCTWFPSESPLLHLFKRRCRSTHVHSCRQKKR